jgi:hypothetical protein
MSSTLNSVLLEIGNNAVLSMTQNEPFLTLAPKQFYKVSFIVDKSVLNFQVFINYEYERADPFEILPILSTEIGKSVKSALFNLESLKMPVDLKEDMKIRIEYNEFDGNNVIVSSSLEKFVNLYDKVLDDGFSLRQIMSLGMSILDFEEPGI